MLHSKEGIAIKSRKSERNLFGICYNYRRVGHAKWTRVSLPSVPLNKDRRTVTWFLSPVFIISVVGQQKTASVSQLQLIIYTNHFLSVRCVYPKEKSR
jgi:hypothetical protein